MSCARDPGAPGQALARPRVVDVLRHAADAWLRSHRPTPGQARLLRDVRRCRTAALGGHCYVCSDCGHEVPVYNSCRNRHCPNCQAFDQARWINARKDVLLPVGHHHVVFTLPAQLRPLARRDPKRIYDLLFDAVRHTLTTLAQEVLDATLGVTAVLHTWTRDLSFHPHVHCIVTGGGLTRNGGEWVPRQGFLFPAARLKARFRARLLEGLDRLQAHGHLGLRPGPWKRLIGSLPPVQQWVVHTEPPFGRSQHVLDYLGRYTHRVAISDARIVAFEHDRVRFATHDGHIAELSCVEFTGRFLQHILPRGFHKIRHFGLYAPGGAHSLERARNLVGPGDVSGERPTRHHDRTSTPELLRDLTGIDLRLCPACGHQTMTRQPLARPPPTGPPCGGRS